MNQKQVRIWLTSLFCLALLLRVLRCFLRNRIGKDAINYIVMAQQLAEGKLEEAFEFNTRIPPLFSYLMSFLVSMGIDTVLAGRLISSISGALLVIPVYYIAKRVLNEKLALLSAFCIAVQPYLIRTSGEVMRDSLFLCLIISALAFAVYAVDKQYARLWYPAGILTGLSVLVRSEGIELVAAGLLWCAYCIVKLIRQPATDESSGKRSGILKGATHQLACMFCFIAMYLLVTIPVQMALVKTPSTWTVVDTRFLSFFDSFFSQKADEIIGRK